MIKVTETIWVGNSLDEMKADVEAILNVAKDLKPTRGWPKVEYYHVGLVDGPGNPLPLYIAAVSVLSSLVLINKKTLVNCHEGKSRSVSVAMMFLAVKYGYTWDQALSRLREQNDVEMPEPHEAHKWAFKAIDWSSLQ